MAQTARKTAAARAVKPVATAVAPVTRTFDAARPMAFMRPEPDFEAGIYTAMPYETEVARCELRTSPRRSAWSAVQKTTAIVYVLRRKGGCGWADITVREWPGGGSIDIQSDYGDYAYSWNSIGHKTFREFLRELNPGYFFGKCMGNSYHVFDGERTRTSMLGDIIRARREESLSRADARLCWEAVKQIDTFSEASFYDSLVHGDYDVIDTLYDGCMDGFATATRPDEQATAFWELVWPVACATWEEEERRTDEPHNTGLKTSAADIMGASA